MARVTITDTGHVVVSWDGANVYIKDYLCWVSTDTESRDDELGIGTSGSMAEGPLFSDKQKAMGWGSSEVKVYRRAVPL